MANGRATGSNASRALGAWLLLSGAALAAAGCLGSDAAPLGDAAPEGPDSLRIGADRLGEYTRHVFNSTGHRLKTDGSGDRGEVVPYDRQSYQERWVGAELQPAVDRFVQDTQTVEYRQRFVTLERDDRQNFTFESSQWYDVAVRRPLYGEFTGESSFRSQECALLFLDCRTVEENETTYHRYYYRSSSGEAPPTLEGRVLKVGRVETLETNLTIGDAPLRQYVNYTPVRVTEFRGERVIAVTVESEVVWLGPEPTRAAAPPRPTNETPPENEPPERINLLYFSSRLAQPVYAVRQSPALLQGRHYAQRSVTTLEEHIEGSGPVPWGVAASHPVLQRLPGAKALSVADFLPDAKEGLTYPLAAAWASLREDLLFPDLREFLADHPSALPLAARYQPDPDRGAFTWGVYVGDAEECRLFESRLQFLPEPAAVPVPQNRAGGTSDLCVLAPPEEPARSEPRLVGFGDALGAWRKATASDDEPGVIVVLGRDARFQQASAPTVSFVRPEFASRGDIVTGGLFGDIWFARKGVLFDLRDGGLAGFNLTFDARLYEWPWVPLVGFAGTGDPCGGAAAWPFAAVRGPECVPDRR